MTTQLQPGAARASCSQAQPYMPRCNAARQTPGSQEGQGPKGQPRAHKSSRGRPRAVPGASQGKWQTYYGARGWAPRRATTAYAATSVRMRSLTRSNMHQRNQWPKFCPWAPFQSRSPPLSRSHQALPYIYPAQLIILKTTLPFRHQTSFS